MRCFPLAVAAALLALVAVPAPAAADCNTTSTSQQIPSGDAAHPFLLATNKLDKGIAIYRETGERPGLQRNDRAHDDTCGGSLPSDELVRFVGTL